MDTEIKVKNYYEIGDRENIVVSNSSLSKINPLEGGSPFRFLEFYDMDKDERQTEAMTRGTMIHNWIQNPDVFAVAEIDKPTEKLGLLVDEVIRIWDGDNDRLPAAVLIARANVAYNVNLKEETFWKKWNDYCLEYFYFIINAKNSGKVVLTQAQKHLLFEVQDKLKTNRLADKLLFRKEEGVLYHEEEEVYWTEIVKVMGVDEPFRLTCKAKIDDFSLNFNDRIITLNDIKSTGFNVSLYPNGFKKYFTYRQLAMYKKAIEMYCKKENYDITDWTWKYNIIACGTSRPYEVKVFDIDPEWIEKGKIELNKLFNRVSRHIISNNWEQTIEEALFGGYTKLKYEA